MNDELKSFNSLTQEIFEIIKTDYGKFLTKEKLEYLDNNNLFKIVDDTIYYQKDLVSYPLKKENLTIQVIVFMCLLSVCSNINPLKILLISDEVNNIITKYNLDENNNIRNFDFIDILKTKILDDLPFNIIFLDTDIEIFNYLVTEKGIKTARLYYDINKTLGRVNNPIDYYLNYQDYDFDLAYDKVYNFINTRII